jgi:hypothetical protein
MADPPAGRPEPSPTNTQRRAGIFTLKSFEPSIVPRKRRSPRHGNEVTTVARSNPEFAYTEDSNGRVTTKEIRHLINSLKEVIAHQTTVIESTKAELLEVKHDQNVLREQNEKLFDEIKTLRERIETPTLAVPTRSWAAVASGSISSPQPSYQKPKKDRNCVRISTQRSFVDPTDNNNGDGNTFSRYLPTDTANTYIRTALLNAPPTQDAQVTGIGTTKTGYVIRFKDPESAEVARNNTEWLNELGNNTKLVKPRFGVVIHRTPTEDFDLENTNAEAIEKIIEENDLTE